MNSPAGTSDRAMSEQLTKTIHGVLLLAHGGPDSLEDVEPFLANIRGGRPFSPHLLEIVRERYRLIGGEAPLVDITRGQGQGVEEEIKRRGNR